MCWCLWSGAVGWGVEVRAVGCRLVRAVWCRGVVWALSSAVWCRVEACRVEACRVENLVSRFQVYFEEGLVCLVLVWAQERLVERAVWVRCRVEECHLASLVEGLV